MKLDKETTLAHNESAKRIVSQLSLEEKVWLMSGKISFKEVREAIKKQGEYHYNYTPYPSGGLPEHDVSPILFCDGPRGVVCGKGMSTCFPVTMLRGATFNKELEEKIGHAIGQEVLAHGGNLFGGVCINLLYNPGWGRGQETYGEDSYHLGEMGVALTKGVQDEGVMACVKHYAFNQMENSRFKVDIDCTKRTEREVFLPHFKKVIDSGAASVMTSYNKYKGTFCGHHDYLINQVLKDEWEFDGFVMSDFVWGVKDTVEAANGGQDMEMCCTKYYGDALVEEVKNGNVPMSKIDEAALRIIRTNLAFAESKSSVESEVIGNQEHIQLALQSAREGITLLKNNSNVLPFDKNETKNILVLGKLAQNGNIGDKGSSEVHPAYIKTPIDGILNIAGNSEVTHYDGKDLAHSRRLAEKADAVIFVVGYDYNDEGEFVAEDKEDVYTGAVGGDRVSNLGLHARDIELIKEVGAVNDQTAVVLIGGSMIMVEEWEESVSSIIMGYYPGMEGGTAIAEILFGEVNPSGKLPYVVPKNESDLPQINWDTDYQYYDYYHGYTKLEKERIEPRYPFGYGLSYTTFSFDHLEVEQDETQLIVECDVTNTGDLYGEEVVQMYVGFKNSSVDRPVKSLKGFCRAKLMPGQTERIRITCQKEELCWYNEETESMEFEHMEYAVFIGSSSDHKDLIKKTIVM